MKRTILTIALLAALSVHAADNEAAYTNRPPTLPRPDKIKLPKQHVIVDTGSKEVTVTIQAYSNGVAIPVFTSANPLNPKNYQEHPVRTFSFRDWDDVLNSTVATNLLRPNGTIRAARFRQILKNSWIEAAKNTLQ